MATVIIFTTKISKNWSVIQIMEILLHDLNTKYIRLLDLPQLKVLISTSGLGSHFSNVVYSYIEKVFLKYWSMDQYDNMKRAVVGTCG